MELLKADEKCIEVQKLVRIMSIFIEVRTQVF